MGEATQGSFDLRLPRHRVGGAAATVVAVVHVARALLVLGLFIHPSCGPPS